MMVSAISGALFASEYPTKVVDGKSYYEYSVEKSEGFYSISKKFGVTQDEIRAANPQTVNGLKEGEHLLIPKKNTQSLTHKVVKGETLFSLKQKYGLTYDDLYEANPSLKTRGLVEGTGITIPKKGMVLEARRNKDKAEREDDVQLVTPKSTPVAQTSSLPEPSQQTAKPNFSAHEVKKGETLFSISRTYNISTDEIVRLNPDAKEGIKVGQILIIPPTHRATAPEPDPSTKKADLKLHVVKKGETVYSISKTYGISQDALIARNPGIDAELPEGKMLIIPPVFKNNEFVETNVQQPTHKIHIVKKEETIFGLSKLYSITQDDLLKMNPELVNGLKEGMVLRIPLSAAENEAIGTADSINSAVGQTFNVEPKNTIDLGLALPWNFAKVSETSSIDATTSKFIEFYNGMLIAIDTLRQAGLNINLHVYDSGKSEAEAKSMLSYPELKNLDFIVGPAFQSQVKAMSDFALAYNVKLVIPFSSKSEEVKNNSNIFQINAPQPVSAANVAHQIATNFMDRNIILLTFSDPKENDRQVWADTLKFSLDAMGVKNTSMVFSNLAEIRKVIDKKKVNLIFPVTTNQVALNKILPIINMLKAKDNEIEIFGFSEWQNYSSISKELFKLNTYFTSPFYIDFKNPQMRSFLLKYRKYNNAEPANTQPMYALLGYDIMMYFADAISHYGHDFEWAIDKMSNPSTLQTGFKFERINDNGGFVNARHYIIENNAEVGTKLYAK